MRYLPVIILSIITLIVASPWITGLVDMYYWFFFNATLSGASYGPERFITMIISGGITIPAMVILTWHLEVEETRRIRERILKEREGEKHE